jgi:hypothetical protein
VKKYFFSFLLIVIAGLPLLAQPADTLVGDSPYFLDMRGRVFQSQGQEKTEEKIGLDSAEVHVLNERGREVIFGYTDEKGRLAFKLPLGRKFTIRVTKRGFVQKLISVDSHVPHDLKKVYTFTFDLDIFERVQGLDISVLEKPVARVAFKVAEKSFSYDVVYTNKVNADLQKMYREYYLLKKREQAVSDSTNQTPVKKRVIPKK